MLIAWASGSCGKIEPGSGIHGRAAMPPARRRPDARRGAVTRAGPSDVGRRPGRRRSGRSAQPAQAMPPRAATTGAKDRPDRVRTCPDQRSRDGPGATPPPGIPPRPITGGQAREAEADLVFAGAHGSSRAVTEALAGCDPRDVRGFAVVEHGPHVRGQTPRCGVTAATRGARWKRRRRPAGRRLFHGPTPPPAPSGCWDASSSPRAGPEPCGPCAGPSFPAPAPPW